jgi:hypothetical protein
LAIVGPASVSAALRSVRWVAHPERTREELLEQARERYPSLNPPSTPRWCSAGGCAQRDRGLDGSVGDCFDTTTPPLAWSPRACSPPWSASCWPATASARTPRRMAVFNYRIAPPTAAHIHLGPPGVAGPVVVPLFAAPGGLPPELSGVCGCVEGVDPGLIRAIRRHPHRYYVNVHNAPYPDGPDARTGASPDCRTCLEEPDWADGRGAGGVGDGRHG